MNSAYGNILPGVELFRDGGFYATVLDVSGQMVQLSYTDGSIFWVGREIATSLFI